MLKNIFSTNKEDNAISTKTIPKIKSIFQNQDFDFNAISPNYIASYTPDIHYVT
jgi:hypothetical protein